MTLPTLAPRPARLLLGLLLLGVSLLALWPRTEVLPTTGWDKANHLLAFALLGLLAHWAWPGAARWRPALALMAYGAAIELAQTQLPPRSGEWPDLLADALGLVLGLGLSRWPLAPAPAGSAPSSAPDRCAAPPDARPRPPG